MKTLKLKQLEYGRVQATVYDEEKQLIIDKFTEENAEKVIALARTQYKDIHIISDVASYTSPGLSSSADIDAVVNEIMQETEELRSLGLLAPFQEGTAIGMIPFEKRKQDERTR